VFRFPARETYEKFGNRGCKKVEHRTASGLKGRKASDSESVREWRGLILRRAGATCPNRNPEKKTVILF
jgi:hypothetical protein